MNNKKFEFEGIPSGDCECFCWAVDKETYIKIEGREPEEWDENHFHKGLYSLYPNAFFWPKKDKVRITVIVEELDNP